ncbi:MAG: hypothetical protein DRP66_10560 [Planctomycetota bacterium]|nr:MAG: hypothetical protein DRP66_10560 [Planctomycetota bacterium]
MPNTSSIKSLVAILLKGLSNYQRKDAMTSQARTSRVLIALIVSMTIGAVVLMALDNGGPLRGAWSLVNYLELNPIEGSVSDATADGVRTWGRIEIFYSNTSRGNVRELALLQGLRTGQDLNAHFVICNGLIAEEKTNEIKDGEIQPTERWQAQKPCLSDGRRRRSVDTIRICVVADGIDTMPTETQGTRTADLVGFLRKKYKISRKHVIWPANWPQF